MAGLYCQNCNDKVRGVAELFGIIILLYNFASRDGVAPTAARFAKAEPARTVAPSTFIHRPSASASIAFMFAETGFTEGSPVYPFPVSNGLRR